MFGNCSLNTRVSMERQHDKFLCTLILISVAKYSFFVFVFNILFSVSDTMFSVLPYSLRTEYKRCTSGGADVPCIYPYVR